MAETNFSNLSGHKFMKLTTYRKTGVAVATPVWFAQVGELLYVTTQQTAGKIKRIRNNGRVIVEPCTASGEVLGASADGAARELPLEEADRAHKALGKKYGWQYSAFELLWKVRGIKPTFIEIKPA